MSFIDRLKLIKASRNVPDATLAAARWIRLKREDRLVPKVQGGEKDFWDGIKRSSTVTPQQLQSLLANWSQVIQGAYQGDTTVYLVLAGDRQTAKELLFVESPMGSNAVKSFSAKWDDRLGQFNQ